jgi:hypothetical protein
MLAFYFLVIGHVSRAWIMIGLSVRLALALGLHLRNEDPSLDTVRKEALVKTWWCLHSIECLLSSITGRPPVIANEDCTISLPQATSGSPERDSSLSRQASRIRINYSSPQTSASSPASGSSRREADGSHYLHTYISLTIISQKVLLNLYSPRTAAQSWEVCALSVFSSHILVTSWFLTSLCDSSLTAISTAHPEKNHRIAEGVGRLGKDSFATGGYPYQ